MKSERSYINDGERLLRVRHLSECAEPILYVVGIGPCYLIFLVRILHFTNADGLIVPVNQQVYLSSSLQIFIYIFIIFDSL